MITLDTKSIDEIGLAHLPEDDKEKLLQVLLEAAELKVGQVIDDMLTEEQSEEMLALIKANDPQSLKDWLKTNVPDYEKIVQKQIDLLKDDFKKDPDAFAALLEKE